MAENRDRSPCRGDKKNPPEITTPKPTVVKQHATSQSNTESVAPKPAPISYNSVFEGRIVETFRFTFVSNTCDHKVYYVLDDELMVHRFDESCKYFQYDEKDSIYYCNKTGYCKFSLSTGKESQVLCLQGNMDSLGRYTTIYTGKYTENGIIPENDYTLADWRPFIYHDKQILCNIKPMSEWCLIYRDSHFKVFRKKGDGQRDNRDILCVSIGDKLSNDILIPSDHVPYIRLACGYRMLLIDNTHYAFHK